MYEQKRNGSAREERRSGVANHVSFFRAKAQPGRGQAVIDQFATWDREQKAKAKGFVRSIVVASKDDPDELMGRVEGDPSVLAGGAAFFLLLGGSEAGE